MPRNKTDLDELRVPIPLLVLSILSDGQPQHGYVMMQMISLDLPGYELGENSIYPVLHAMERNGYVVSERVPSNGRLRRVYSITPEGRKHQRFLTMQALILIRAMENAVKRSRR